MPGFSFGNQGGFNSLLPSGSSVHKVYEGIWKQFLLVMSVSVLNALLK